MLGSFPRSLQRLRFNRRSETSPLMPGGGSQSIGHELRSRTSRELSPLNPSGNASKAEHAWMSSIRRAANAPISSGIDANAAHRPASSSWSAMRPLISLGSQARAVHPRICRCCNLDKWPIAGGNSVSAEQRNHHVSIVMHQAVPTLKHVSDRA